MAKIQYQFDPDTLSYVKINRGFKYFFKYSFIVLLLASVVGVILTITFLAVVDSPKEKEQKREIANLKLQIELVNKDLDQVQKILGDVQQRDDNIYRVVFEAEPIPNSIRQAGFGGSNRYEHLKDMESAELVIGTRMKLDQIRKQVFIQSKSLDEIVELARNKEKMLRSIPAVMPIAKKNLARVASGWGYRIHPIYKTRRFHYGMDFTADIGTPIYSTGDGIVKVVRSRKTGYGNHIEIDHGYGYTTLYGHLSKFNVKRGKRVKRGDIIAFSGNTGTSSGPHLHYEVHKNGKQIDPKYFYYDDLTPDEYEMMIQISSNYGQAFD